VLRVRLVPGQGNIPYRLSWTREAIHPPSGLPSSLRRRNRHTGPIAGDPVVLSTLHYPVLLTCTAAFHVSVYTLTSPKTESTEPSQPLHLSTMHSDVSFHPAALSLFPLANEGTHREYPPTPDPARKYRAALTFCTPLYPSSWCVSVQEFGVDLARRGNTGDVWRGECLTVGRGDEPELGDEIVWPRRIKPIVGVKGRQAVGVGMDGRWCVLAGDDNQIQVYSLPPTSSSSTGSANGRYTINHSHTLLAHSADVTSISLNAGRCVTGGRDGRVLVWELDEEVEEGDKLGRTVGYVEVKPGGRREIWRGPTGPVEDEDEGEDEDDEDRDERKRLPHPASISSAARSLFLPRPPEERIRREGLDRPPVVRGLVFDEEKIVGFVREGEGQGVEKGEVMKVWRFNG
jgi:hypothetical protein